MALILVGLISAIILGAKPIIDTMFDGIVPIAFKIESHLNTNISSGNIPLNFDSIFSLFFNIGISLIVLKFLKKGFETYILWQDGDPDLDPLNLIISFIKAIALAICFPIFYDFLVQVSTKLIDDTVGEINGLLAQNDVVGFILEFIEAGIFQAICGIAAIICFLILYFQFIIRGVEMFVMRIGFPVVCCGLLDSDKGIFAPYVKKFIQNAFTVIIQMALIKLSLTLMSMSNLIYSLAICIVAIKTPRFLQEFLVQSGGGGNVFNNVYQTSRLVQMGKGVLNRGK